MLPWSLPSLPSPLEKLGAWPAQNSLGPECHGPLSRTGGTWVLFSLGMYLPVGGTLHYIRVCTHVCPRCSPSINCLTWLECVLRLH